MAFISGLSAAQRSGLASSIDEIEDIRAEDGRFVTVCLDCAGVRCFLASAQSKGDIISKDRSTVRLAFFSKELLPNGFEELMKDSLRRSFNQIESLLAECNTPGASRFDLIRSAEALGSLIVDAVY